MQRQVEKFMDQEGLHRTEGRAGVILLARLARALGYKDPQYFGSLNSQCTIGDLICFLEDNPGAVEVIVEWIGKQRNADWKMAIVSQLDPGDGNGDAEDDDD